MGSRLHAESCFAWVVPIVPFVLAYLDLAKSPHYVNPATDQPSPSVWSELFGTTCGDTECLYQLTATVPFVCAVAYSVTAFCIRRKSQALNRQDSI